MALTIYRFRTVGEAIADISREVPGNPTFSAASSVYVDIQVDSANLADLQDAMAARGWTLDTTAPGNTPQQQEASTTPPSFSGVSTALAAATAAVAFNAQRLTGVADPTSAQDAATKAYVDATKTGLDLKDSVRLIATTPLATNTRTGNVLTASANGVLGAVDGVTPALNDRILVAGEATGANNGIYFVSSVGAVGAPWTMTRATDADAAAEVTAGMYAFVTEGTANADSGWVLTTNDPITLNTTALAFTQFSGAGSIIAGTGLTKTGNTINVIANADGSIVANADDIQVGVLATDAQHGNRGGGTLHAVVIAAGAAGFMSGTDKSKLDGLPTTPKTDTLLFGVSGIGTTTTARFLPPGYSPTQAPTTAVQFRVPTAGTLRNLRVRAGTVGVGAANVTYTVRKNGTATAVTCVAASTVQDLSDLVNTVTVAAGDLIDVTVTKAASITTSPVDVVASLELAP